VRFSTTGRPLAASPKTRIDRLALQCEDPEGALVDAVQQFSARESFERLDPKRELTERH
jgi:hypothetical protein